MGQGDQMAGTSSSFNPVTYSVLYRGSVKDVRGPVSFISPDGDSPLIPGVIFDYSDAYSVFDWGKMPDAIPRKGAALALIAADWFERLERAETWREYSRQPDATSLRKGNRFGSIFNEIGEELQSHGIRTHFLGVLPEGSGQLSGDALILRPTRLAETPGPVRHLAVRQVSWIKPQFQTVLGRGVPDYLPTLQVPSPRLIPLEVVFRFSVPEGSSLLERVARDPGYLASIGFPECKLEKNTRWDFPILELFTKLEPSDRALGLSEALAISGLSATRLQELLLKTAWIAGLLRSICGKRGIELADGKLEWAIRSETGELFLVDAVGPDELRLLKQGVQLSKEFLRIHYRQTPWYKNVLRAKELAQKQGISEWKKFVGDQPPPLPSSCRDLGSHLYMALANELTGHHWFPEAWSLAKVVEGIAGLHPDPAGDGHGLTPGPNP